MALNEKQKEDIKSELQKNFDKNKIYTLFKEFSNPDTQDNNNDFLTKPQYIENFRFKNLQSLPSFNLKLFAVTVLLLIAMIASAFVSLIAPFAILGCFLVTLFWPIGRILLLEDAIENVIKKYKATDLNNNEEVHECVLEVNNLYQLLATYNSRVTFIFRQENYIHLANLVCLEMKLALNSNKRPYMESSESVYRICKNAMQHPSVSVRLIAAAIAAEWCSTADKQKFAIDAEIAANVCIYLYINFDIPNQNINKLAPFLPNGNYLTAHIDYHHAALLNDLNPVDYCEKLINVVIKNQFCKEGLNQEEFKQINLNAIKSLRELDDNTFNKVMSTLPFDDVKLVKNITLRSAIKLVNIILQPEQNETDLEYIIRMINSDDIFAQAKINDSNQSTWLHFLLDIATNNCIANYAYIKAIKKLIKNIEPNQRDEHGHTAAFYDRYNLLSKAGYKSNLFPGLDEETRVITEFLENLLPETNTAIETEHGLINYYKEKQQLLILAGPPGVGKTTLPEHIAKLHGFDFIQHERGEFGDMYVGGVSARISKLFDDAKKNKNGKKGVIIFIDEIDSLLPNRNGYDVHASTKESMLHDFQVALEKAKGYSVGLICSTNKPENLPESWISRGAGQSNILEFKLPFEQLRFDILNEKLKYIPIFEEDLRLIAKLKNGASARDLTLFVVNLQKVSKACTCADDMRNVISKIENIDLNTYYNSKNILLSIDYLKQWGDSMLHSFTRYMTDTEEEQDEKNTMAKKFNIDYVKLCMINN